MKQRRDVDKGGPEAVYQPTAMSKEGKPPISEEFLPKGLESRGGKASKVNHRWKAKRETRRPTGSTLRTNGSEKKKGIVLTARPWQKRDHYSIVLGGPEHRHKGGKFLMRTRW